MLVLCAVVSVGTFIRTSLVPRTESSPFLGSYLPKEEQQRERVPQVPQHLLCVTQLLLYPALLSALVEGWQWRH